MEHLLQLVLVLHDILQFLLQFTHVFVHGLRVLDLFAVNFCLLGLSPQLGAHAVMLREQGGALVLQPHILAVPSHQGDVVLVLTRAVWSPERECDQGTLLASDNVPRCLVVQRACPLRLYQLIADADFAVNVSRAARDEARNDQLVRLRRELDSDPKACFLFCRHCWRFRARTAVSCLLSYLLPHLLDQILLLHNALLRRRGVRHHGGRVRFEHLVANR
jgi:hypothetical protein